ncbi:unnamed protein product [Polarella glacialis]|uniref:Uncharacterized protein n=1 Tax=Polarella glacialis TaxID=89957 RepID=A0A813H4X8_POLGL|nr:unnamed protein product [Polarella glacialis]
MPDGLLVLGLTISRPDLEAAYTKAHPDGYKRPRTDASMEHEDDSDDSLNRVGDEEYDFPDGAVQAWAEQLSKPWDQSNSGIWSAKLDKKTRYMTWTPNKAGKPELDGSDLVLGYCLRAWDHGAGLIEVDLPELLESEQSELNAVLHRLGIPERPVRFLIYDESR